MSENENKIGRVRTRFLGTLTAGSIAVAALLTPVISQAAPDAPAAANETRDESQNTQQRISAEEAFSRVKTQAESGDGGAMNMLGNFYEQGIGVPRNFAEAFKWYQKSADAKLPIGYYNVGIAYEIGIGNAGDQKKAIEYFRLAADAGVIPAMQKMASLSIAGQGVKKDEAQGLEWLVKAADAGSAEAANTVGVVHHQGLLGQKKNDKKAYTYFMKAAELGHIEAIKNIAVIYKDGIGRSKNNAEALKWYLIAQRGGYQAADLDDILTNLRSSMKADDVTKAEADAEKWLASFAKKMEENQKKAAGK